MARVPQVTRTIPMTIVTIFCINLDDKSTFEQSITLPRTYKDEKSMMEAVEQVLEGEPIKAVSIVSSEVQRTLYGMSEADFIRYATVLPPRGTKADSESCDDADADSESCDDAEN